MKCIDTILKPKWRREENGTMIDGFGLLCAIKSHLRITNAKKKKEFQIFCWIVGIHFGLHTQQTLYCTLTLSSSLSLSLSLSIYIFLKSSLFNPYIVLISFPFSFLQSLNLLFIINIQISHSPYFQLTISIHILTCSTTFSHVHHKTFSLYR